MLVDVFLYCMIEDYGIYLENSYFASFSKLMEAAKHMNELSGENFVI